MSQLAAQQQMPSMPVDKNVRIGHLENGLTYYIRHNALPANRAEFYIAQKVGSIQEEPQQRGLAHFLEHMAFNGTQHFPGDASGKSIVAWCETMGIKFGNNLNAYTSVEETVYNISNAPVDKAGVLDSCLLILHDWSSYILLKDDEIDKERGVIREEWRSRNSGILRVYTELSPTIYGKDKYADCMPIGSIDVINNFPYEAIREYYHKWYRPDLQGLIIVGDIDVDAVEAKIKALFADVPKPVNPAERIYYPVSNNTEPIVAIGTDKEVDDPSIEIDFKHDITPRDQRNSIPYYVQRYVTNIISSMLNARLDELRQSANPPFIRANSYYGTFFLSNTKDAFTLSASAKVDGIEEALKALLTEAERARRYGFTASEYERAKANYLQALESAYNEREKMKSPTYVSEYTRAFLDNEPIPGIEWEYTTMNNLVPNIPLELINQQMLPALMPDTNQVVIIAAPEKEGMTYPTKAYITSLLKGMKDLDVQPYVDKVSDEPLLKTPPTGGTIVKEETNQVFGTTKLTLSNGITIYLKPTDYKADEIRMRGISWGGTSLFPDKDALDMNYINSVTSIGGLGNFSATELPKILAGKKATVSTGVGDIDENVNGTCSPKDFETMMQLTYLNFTAPRKDDEAFASFKNRRRADLEAARANPLSTLNDSLRMAVYGKHPRVVYEQPETLDKIDYNHVIELYQDRFKDASDFTFYFVGNIDMEKVKPLIAQYIGGLPVTHRKETWRDNHVDMRKGIYKNEYAKEQQTPMATVVMVYHGKLSFNPKNSLLLNYMTQIMRMIYTDEIREKEGGTYSVSCNGSLTKYPHELALFQIVYQTDPAKKEHLNGLVTDLLKKFATEGPSADQLNKVKEYVLKTYADSQKENSYWMSRIANYFYYGLDLDNSYTDLVNSITAKDVQQFAAELLKQGNEVEVTMTAP
ncbi:MAG: insulinase family protein [Prevotellaceae bacterium]|nr:insulinase family protein [Prevotellaceae bacterium]